MMYKSSILENVRWSINMDLVHDLNVQASNQLIQRGYACSSIDNALKELYNVEKMLLPAHPRKVEKSKEFTCPVGFEMALNEFTRKVEMGDILTPYMTDKVLNSAHKDLMLYDWNIHHFHLTRRTGLDGFMSRSPYQLFAYVTDRVMYMIQAYPHPGPTSKTNPYGYSKQEMISIIYRNWPELIEKNKLPGQAHLTVPMNDEDFAIARQERMTSFVDIGDGNVFGLIGGGYASDGSSIEAVRRAYYWYNTLKLCEMNIVNTIRQIHEAIETLLGRKAEVDMQIFLLFVEKENILTYDKANKIIIEIGMNEAYMKCVLPQHLFWPMSNSLS